MQVLQEDYLVALRDAFRKLEEAVSVSNLALVESATVHLRELMGRVGAGGSAVLERDVALLRQVDESGEELSALLASRLRAFKLALAAWQSPDPGR